MPPRPALNRNALLFCNSDFAEELLIARDTVRVVLGIEHPS